MDCSSNKSRFYNDSHAVDLQMIVGPTVASSIDRRTKNPTKSIQDVWGEIIRKLKTQQKFEFANEASGKLYEKSMKILYKDLIGLLENTITRLRGLEDFETIKRLAELNFDSITGLTSGHILEDTDPEEPSSENIPEMPNEELRNKLKLDDLVKDFYGVALKAAAYRLEEFAQDLYESTILNGADNSLVRSNVDLNWAICGLKNKYFKNIVDYIKSQDPSFEVSDKMFDDNGNVIPGYEWALNKFYNMFIKLQRSGNIQDEITNGWKHKLYGTEGSEFYTALNSYVNLLYFDLSLKPAIGEIIKLSDSSYSGILMDVKYLKYTFSSGDEHKRKGFQNTENRDALNDVAKFSKVIIGNVPIILADTGKSIHRKLTLGVFCNAVNSLFTNAHLLGREYKTLYEAIVNYHSNPYYYSKVIFSEIMNPNKKVLQALLSVGINQFNINVLASVYKYFFDLENPRSILNMETKDIKSRFVIDGYSIIDCLNGVIDRTMDATYLLLQYQSDSNMMEVTLKKKYASRRNSYNISNNINTRNANRSFELREILVNKYKPKNVDLLVTENPDYGANVCSITLGDNNILVAKNNRKNGILDNTPLTLKFSNLDVIKEILSPYKNVIDLTSTTVCLNLINNSGLSEKEQIFRKILEFIDDHLNTNFLSEDGLTKLLYYKMMYVGDNYLNSILDSAVRTAMVNQFYYNFEKGLREGKYTSWGSFETFLKENYAPYTQINFDSYKEIKGLLVKRLGIPRPVSVFTSESWIDAIAEAEATMTGAVSASTTKDIHGNKIANNRTSFLGGNMQYYLSKYRLAGEVDKTATEPLLFTKNSGLVVKTVFDADAKSRLGTKKSTKDMKASELFYSSIIHKFYGNFLLDKFNPKKFREAKNDLQGTIITLPTTFSDKVSFVNYAISANKPIRLEGEKFKGRSYQGKTIWQLNSSELTDLYLDTVGAAYINLYDNVLDDLRNVLDMPNATFEDIDAKLHETKWDDLLNMAQAKGIELQLDTHYRKNGDYCKFNELLYHYATDLFVNGDSLRARFESEKVNFINDLLTSGASFYTAYYDESDDVYNGEESSNPIAKIIDELTGKDSPFNLSKNEYYDKWVKNHRLILAKVDGKEIVNGALINYVPGMNIELNPLLEKYFFTDSLVSNNLRFELTGSEVAHPNKAKINFGLKLDAKGITPDTAPNYFERDNDGNIIMKDGYPKVIDRFNDLVWLKKLAELDPRLKSVYNEAILKVEAMALGTQLKRNVIIPATLLYEQLMTLNGIPKRMKVAVIEDTKAGVFNFRGDVDKIDAHDGSAYINPFISILENKALQDLEVGVDKKPIWHSYNPRLMSATLLKFATFTMTNERMRTSMNGNIELYKLFKLMTNLLWLDLETGKWNNERGLEFNLVDTVGFKKGRARIKFSTITSEKPYYYEENGNYYRITGFDRDADGNYYTEEQLVSLTGVDIGPALKVYHYYDAQSNHYKFQSAEKPNGFHTINSLFELFNAFGGIYSGNITSDESGIYKFEYNDASSYAVVNFMNNVSIRVGNDTNDMSLRTYYQPLKEMMIAYAANASAVKNGTANINKSDAWRGDSSLRYMTLDSDGLGIQMDADHNIDESEMTEFSQVISALEAGGRLHRYSKEVYKTLGSLAVLASKDEIDTAVRYINAKLRLKAREEAKAAGKPITDDRPIPIDRIRSELYDIVGRTIINNYKERGDKVDLAKPIILEIKKTFNLNEDHNLDKMLLPFSDSNLYSLVISLFISTINSKSIKRKYPGSGCVMVPGYGIILTYKYAGKTQLFDDVLKEARKANKIEKFYGTFDASKYSITDYNRYLVNAYLGKHQLEEWKKASAEVGEYVPTDIVDVLADGKYLGTIELNEDTYYAFLGFTENDLDGEHAEATRRGFISKYLGMDISNVKDLTFATNVTRPKNLAPARITWEYEAEKELNDAILSRSSDNEFNSDVAVILKPSSLNIWFLGTDKDLAQFRNWLGMSQGKQVANNDPILAQVSLVVNRNPLIATALQAMGATVEQYAAYVEDIFPKSKEKDIYWHGSNSDFSQGFDTAQKGVGSGAPETGGEFYLAKQPYSVLQYVNGLNRTAGPDKNGFAHWNKLYWALKEIMSNGRRENNDWKDLIIGNDPNNVRKEIPNKRGEFNRSGEGEQHGKFLDEYKDEYGYKDRTDEEFFRDIFGIDYGAETFNNWIARNKAIFQSMEADPNVKGIYPAVINVSNPIIERGKNTYYGDRGLFDEAVRPTKTVKTNIFITRPVRESFLRRKDKTFSGAERLRNRKEIQKIFDELDGGRYLGKGISNLKNEAAELVISNMYASKFNTKGKSLAEIVENPNFFRVANVRVNSKYYDMAYTTNNGKHVYITFKLPKIDEQNAFKPKYKLWKYIAPKGKEVYATTKDGLRLFKIGTYVKRPDISVFGSDFKDELGNIYTRYGDDYKDTNGNILRNPKIINGEVVEYFEYLSKYTVVEKKKMANGSINLISYDLYHINYENIAKGLKNPTEETINGQAAKILSDLFKSNRFNGIRLNYSMFNSTARKIANVIPKMIGQIDGPTGNIGKLLQYTLDTYLQDIKDDKDVKGLNDQFHNIDKIKYDKDLIKFYEGLLYESYASFLKSLTFTASRIPALTLLSFMLMKAVALTLSSKNIAYVSHWQTWLLGSDY